MSEKMGEGSRFEGARETQEELVGNTEVEYLERSPWGNLTEDLATLEQITANPDLDEDSLQTIISNSAAVHAVKKGWLKVEKIDGEYAAFTTPSWKKQTEEDAKMRKEQKEQSEKNTKKHEVKTNGKKKENQPSNGPIKFENGNGNGNGNHERSIQQEKSVFSVLSHVSAIAGRFKFDAINGIVTIFTDRDCKETEVRFEGPNLLHDLKQYIFTNYSKKHD